MAFSNDRLMDSWRKSDNNYIWNILYIDIKYNLCLKGD